ncbi:MAG: hypothetical protein IT463_10130 [Planctomycetes bacterium]|nr:hypothetical protein [Planctomycetota bacterium]
MADTVMIQRIHTDERVEGWRNRCLWMNTAVSLGGLLSFLLFHGRVFPDRWEPWVALFQAVCLVVLMGETLGVYWLARHLKTGWAYAVPDSVAVLTGALLGAALLVFSPLVSGVLDDGAATAAFAYLTQAGLLALVAIRLLRVFSFVTRLVRSPLLVFMASFVGLIVCGAGLLMLPGSRVPGFELSVVDALFMSTSATCVTGLAVVDIGSQFTRFGQLVILALIQVGGLGIMTFAAFFSLMYGRGMGVREGAAMGEVLSVDTVGRVGRMLGGILGITAACEAAGAIALYGNWVGADGTPLPAGEQIYYAVFHSISAFCNAGFSLHGDSLVRYAGDWPTLLPISFLIIIGGLGFTVILDLLSYRFWAHPWLRRIPALHHRLRRAALPRLTVQTKLVLLTTGTLLALGAVGIWGLEAGNLLQGREATEQAAVAVFHGLSPRTAGFNTVDLADARPATNYFTILLMLVGGSPGSTAGGLQTTTIALMLLAVLATLRGRSTEAFRRRLPDGLIRKSLVMLVLVLVFINAATLALMVSESGGIAAAANGFEMVTFEVVSAFCTVGLTMGATAKLTAAGKLIIILCMFVGRVGPLTLVLALGSRSRQRFEYPDEGVMIG